MKKIVLSNKQALTFLCILVIILMFLVSFYTNICVSAYNKYVYSASIAKIYNLNKTQVFKIKKITLFSNIDAKDLTQDNSMKNLNISQYTDIAIEIDNTAYQEEINNTNTIKQIVIENIKIVSDEKEGIKSLTYKNPNNFGKYEETKASLNYTKDSQNYANIYFDGIYSNEEVNYDMPNFYTDCSNPICLTYINKNIVSNLKVPDNTNIDLNGQLLNHISYPTQNLVANIEFNIKIINNDDQEFSYLVKFELNPDNDNDLSSDGFSYQCISYENNDESAFLQFK